MAEQPTLATDAGAPSPTANGDTKKGQSSEWNLLPAKPSKSRTQMDNDSPYGGANRGAAPNPTAGSDKAMPNDKPF